MNINAVLFDMDGVIVDTEPLHHRAYFEMFEHYGIEMTEELYQTFTGKSTRNVCQLVKDKLGADAKVEELIRTKRRFFKDYFDHDKEFDMLPGVFELIKNYHQNGLKLVLASSASENTIRWVFDRFKLHSYFMGTISGATLKASKPHPEIFEKAAEIAGEPREKCMVIEDSTNGIAAAFSAGIFTVAYKSVHSKAQDYSKANMIISDFDEIKYDRIKKI